MSKRGPSDDPSPEGPGCVMPAPDVPVIGWREWVALPDLGIHAIKAKVDTGARTSALHAINIEYVQKAGATWVRFEVHPLQRDAKTIVHAEAPLLEKRHVMNSGGKRTLRPVIETAVEICGRRHAAEITLISRDEMGFRMLLGRQAIRGHFLVHPGRSYRGGRLLRKKPKKNKAAADGRKTRASAKAPKGKPAP
jgi:hypothetical protein